MTFALPSGSPTKFIIVVHAVSVNRQGPGFIVVIVYELLAVGIAG